MKMLADDECLKVEVKPLHLLYRIFGVDPFLIFDIQGDIAEFVVSKALGLDEPHNKDCRSLYDIPYRGKRVETKGSSYYHLFPESGKAPRQRVFRIEKANSAYENRSR